MAKGKKKGTKRRRSVGGMNSKTMNLVVTIGGGLIGYFAGDKISEQLNKVNPIKKKIPATASTPASEVPNDNVTTVAEIGIGGALLLMKKAKGILGHVQRGVGGIAAGAGLRASLVKLGVVHGYQNVPVVGGYQSVPVIGGNGLPAQLAGVPGQLQGFKVNGYDAQGSGVMGSCIEPNSGSGINTGSGFMQ